MLNANVLFAASLIAMLFYNCSVVLLISTLIFLRAIAGCRDCCVLGSTLGLCLHCAYSLTKCRYVRDPLHLVDEGNGVASYRVYVRYYRY